MILVINIGSTSKRYALFQNSRCIGHYYLPEDHPEYHTSAHYILYLLEHEHALIPDQLTALAFRIVAPGTYFTKQRIITTYYCKQLKKVSMLAPTHTRLILQEITEFRALLAHTPFIGISDSAFHSTMPLRARLYGLPTTLTRTLDVYRFGYHGISVQSVLNKLSKNQDHTPDKILICHLGGGSSVTAVKSGMSIDTSMGFTPLEGLVMATRSGTLDPAAGMYIAQKYKLTAQQLLELLVTQSGLKGLAGTSNMRDIILHAQQGDKQALIALDLFVYILAKYIGAYTVALGGLDCLIFTGTIGERAPIIRERTCAYLQFMDVLLDNSKNSICIGEHDSIISSSSSRVQVAVLATDEMSEIYTQAQKILKLT